MAQRWSMGTLTAVVVAIATALSVAATAPPARWEVALHLSPAGIELSATSQNVSVALTL